MRRFACLTPLTMLAAWLAFPAAAPAQPPMGLERIVLTERDAVLLEPPVVVADGVVGQADWSGDGKNILAIRTRFSLPPTLEGRPSFETAVVLWNKESQRSRTVWRSVSLPEPSQVNLHWVGRGLTALGTVDVWKTSGPLNLPGKPAPAASVRQRWLARLDARSGAFRLVSQLPEDADVQPSTSRALALLVSNAASSLRFVRADGTITDPVSLPAGDPFGGPQWDQEGSAVVVGRILQREKKAPEIAWYSIDPATGRNQRLRDQPQPSASSSAMADSGGVRLVQRQATLVEEKTTAKIRPLWLEAVGVKPEAEQPRALLASNAEWGKLSPDGDSVLYLSDGAAWVCPLRHMPKEVYLAARAAAQRQMYLSNGKQLALGCLMYAQDYDETLPGAGEDIQAMIMPYLKSTSLFDRFQYTFPGGKLASIDEPAKTLLGFIPVEGGRVQIFVDGHVIFEPSP